MKKLIFSLAILALTMVACQNNSEEAVPNQEAVVDMSDFYVYTDAVDNLSAKSEEGTNNGDKCASMKVLNQQLKDNPGLENRMFAIEKHTREYIAAKGSTQKGKPSGGGGTTPTPYVGTVNIPVYVYVIYANSTQNISLAQINSQISVLNADFNDTNYNDVPAEFRAVGADIDINFNLVTVDRRSNSTAQWGTNNAVKSAYPAVPGYLTFWVANIGGGILGYAQFPGGSASTDGVVISPQYFGVTSGAYGLGRTATHEVGHWLNLRHIWGDGRCQQDDFVTDTPSSDGPNYGCPAYPTVNCQSNDMTQNYMDYTDDACMNIFTLGQNDRIRAIFASGGARESFVQ